MKYPNSLRKVWSGLTALALVALGLAPALSFGAPETWRRARGLPRVRGVESVQVRTLVADQSRQQLVYGVPAPQAVSRGVSTADGRQQYRLIMGNAFVHGEPGEPVLPLVPCKIVLPQGHSIKRVSVRRGPPQEMEGKYLIEHGQTRFPLIPGVRVQAAERDQKIYGSDAAFPAKRYELVGVYKQRGVQIAFINLFPVEYRPTSGKITYYPEMFVDVTTEAEVMPRNAGTARAVKFRASAASFLQSRVDNPEILAGYTAETSDEGSSVQMTQDPPGVWPELPCAPSNSYEYVVVTTEAMRDAGNEVTVADLVYHKRDKGLTATIVTMEDILAEPSYTGVDDAETLRNFITDAYNNWGTEFVLLGGDTDVVPMRTLYAMASFYEDEIPSDVYFQCLDGTFDSDGDGVYGEYFDGPSGSDVDLLHEVAVGRASAEDEDEMENFVYKILDYETSEKSESFLTNALMVGEHLGFGGVSEYAKDSMEEIRLGSDTHGYTTEGFASKEIFNVDTLYEEEETWDAEDITGLINDNTYSVINHLGHSSTDYCMKFYNDDADELTNTRFLFAYSQGCIPGAFDRDCIGEHLTTSTKHGMFSVVFNARYGWGTYNSTDGPSQQYNRPFWHAYFGEGEDRLGLMNAYAHEYNIPKINYSCMRWCFYESNLLGDPEGTIYGLIPLPSVYFDRKAYRSDATSLITVVDPDVDPNDTTVPITVRVTEDGGAGMVRWETNTVAVRSEEDFEFTNAIPLTTTSMVRAAEGDLLTVTYHDSMDRDLTDEATIDNTRPVIFNVQVTGVAEDRGAVTWATDEPADSHVMLSTNLPVTGTMHGTNAYTTRSVVDQGVTQYLHSVTVTGLVSFSTLYAVVFSEDYAGNATNYPSDPEDPDPLVYPRLVTQGRFTSYENTMDDGERGWSTTNVLGGTVWEYGIPTYGPSAPYTGTKCWGTVLNGRYPALENAWVQTEAMHVKGNPRLTFWTWYSFAYDDRGYIEVNDGTGWYNVTTNADIAVASYFTGSSYGWKQVTVDLADYSNSTWRVRFRLDSDASSQSSGWYIDDLSVTHTKQPGVYLVDYSVDDATGGDGDGYAEPGETIALDLLLFNSDWKLHYTNLTGEVGSTTKGLSFDNGVPTDVAYGNLLSGEYADSGDQVLITIADSVATGTVATILQSAAADNGGPWEHRVDLEIVDRVAIRGTITDMGTGLGIEGASVQAAASGYETISTRTDASGDYALNGCIDGVSYTVTASKPGEYSPADSVHASAPADNVDLALGKAFANPDPLWLDVSLFEGESSTNTLVLDNTAGSIPYEYTASIDYFWGTGWLSVSPDSGSVAAGSSNSLTVVIDSAGVVGATYFASIVLEGNDVSGDDVEVFVILQVTGEPSLQLGDITVSGGDEDGYVEPGETAELTLGLENVGTGPATNVTGVLTSVDTNLVRIGTTNAVAWPDIEAGESQDSSSVFVVQVDPSVTNGSLLEMELLASDGAGRSWTLPVEVACSARHTVTGSVTDANSGDPVEGVTVTITGESGSVSTNTGSDGIYALGGFLDGDYTIEFDPPYPYSGPLPFDFTLTGPAWIWATVLNLGEGAPMLSLESVTLVDDTDSDGFVEPGETAEFAIALRNTTSNDAVSVVGDILVNETNAATVLNPQLAWPDIYSNSVEACESNLVIQVSPSNTADTTLSFELTVYDGNTPPNLWVMAFDVDVTMRYSISGTARYYGSLQPAPGVTIASSADDGTVQDTTDLGGDYRLNGFSTGNVYEVTATAGDGYVSPSATNVTVTGDVADVDFVIVDWGLGAMPASITTTITEYATAQTLLQIQNTNAAGENRAVELSVRLTEGLSPVTTGADSDSTAVDWYSLPPSTYAEDRLLVMFEPGVTPADRVTTLRDAGFQPIHNFKYIPCAAVQRPDVLSLGASVAQLETMPGVVAVEPDFIGRIAKTPDDPRFESLYGLYNERQTGGTRGADIGAVEAWDITTGSRDVVIGVVDTGVFQSHEDLIGNLWTNVDESVGDANGDGAPGISGVDDDGDGYADFDDPQVALIFSNGLDDDGDGTADDEAGGALDDSPGVVGFDDDGDGVIDDYDAAIFDDDENGYVDDVNGWNFHYDNDDVDDLNGHGTHVAGTIGAVGSNGVGVVGVAWQTTIMSLPMFDHSGRTGYVSSAIQALEYAIDKGVKVSNHSWGGGIPSSALSAAITSAGTNGHLLVCSAGNDGDNTDLFPNYPASFPQDNIISVAATDDDDLLASFSCYGESTVDLAAPGVSILSTVPDVSPYGAPLDGSYSTKSGTSMAAPHVTGVLALMLSVAPGASVDMLKDAVLNGARHDLALDGLMVTGGHLDAPNGLRAVTAGWLQVDPDSGTVPGSGTLDIDVTLNAGGQLGPGTYEADILVAGERNTLTVPVSLEVLPGPAPVYVSTRVLGGDGDGYAEPGENVYLSIRLLNRGSLKLRNPMGTLAAAGGAVSISDGSLAWNSINSGSRAFSTDDAFVYFGHGGSGSEMFTLTVEDSLGASWVLPAFEITVAERLSITGTVTESSGAPVADALVEFWGPQSGTTFTDATGGYRINGLSNDVYKVRVTANVYARSEIAEVSTVSGDAVQDFVLWQPAVSLSATSVTGAVQVMQSGAVEVVVQNTSSDPFEFECYEMPMRKVALISDDDQLVAVGPVLEAMGMDVSSYTSNYLAGTYYSADDALVFEHDMVIHFLAGRNGAERQLTYSEWAVYEDYLERGGKLLIAGRNPLSRPDDVYLSYLVNASTLDRSEQTNSQVSVVGTNLNSIFLALNAGDTLYVDEHTYDLAYTNGLGPVYLQAGAAAAMLGWSGTNDHAVYNWSGMGLASNWSERTLWQDLLKNVVFLELQEDVPWLDVHCSGTNVTDGSVTITQVVNTGGALDVGTYEALVLLKGHDSGAENHAIHVTVSVVPPTFKAASSTGVTDWTGNPLNGDGSPESSLLQLLWAGNDGMIDPPEADGSPTGDDVLLQVFGTDEEFVRFGKGYESWPDYGLFRETFAHGDSLLTRESRAVYVRAWDGASFEVSVAYGDSSLYELTYEANESHDFGSWVVDQALGYPDPSGNAPDTNGDSVPDGWYIELGLDPRADMTGLTASSSVLSGFGSTGSNLDDFIKPTRMFLTDNLVFVLDTGANRIKVWNRDKEQYMSTYGGSGTALGKFSQPYGLGKHPAADRFAIADTGNNRIQVFAFNPQTGSVSNLFAFGSMGAGEGDFNEPRGVAMDEDGHIYVADTLNHRVQLFDATGTFLDDFGAYGTAMGSLNKPEGITVDANGVIWVADTHNHRIQLFTTAGSAFRTFGISGTGSKQFDKPSDVKIGFDDRVFVADQSNHRIQIFDDSSSHNHLLSIGVAGSASGQMLFPYGLAPVIENDEVYVVDTGNDRIQRFGTVIDVDGDGMDDSWEILNFGSTSQGATGDYDDDGVLNIGEYRINTDPTKADTDEDDWSDAREIYNGLDPLDAEYDFLRVTAFSATNQVIMRFVVESNRQYVVESATNLMADSPWTVVPGSAANPVEDGIFEFTNTVDPETLWKFYRPVRTDP